MTTIITSNEHLSRSSRQHSKMKLNKINYKDHKGRKYCPHNITVITLWYRKYDYACRYSKTIDLIVIKLIGGQQSCWVEEKPISNK